MQFRHKVNHRAVPKNNKILNSMNIILAWCRHIQIPLDFIICPSALIRNYRKM